MNRNYRRTTVAVVAGLALTLGLTACSGDLFPTGTLVGSSQQSTEPTDEETTDAPTSTPSETTDAPTATTTPEAPIVPSGDDTLAFSGSVSGILSDATRDISGTIVYTSVSCFTSGGVLSSAVGSGDETTSLLVSDDGTGITGFISGGGVALSAEGIEFTDDSIIIDWTDPDGMYTDPADNSYGFGSIRVVGTLKCTSVL